MPKFENVVEAYFEQNGMFCFDGESGVENFTELVSNLGYDGYGGILNNFLADNPGCIGAMIKWIQANGNDEWEENLLELVDPAVLETYE